jgi:hypothetical protein
VYRLEATTALCVTLSRRPSKIPAVTCREAVEAGQLRSRYFFPGLRFIHHWIRDAP